MLNEPTLEQMRQLGLTGMLAAYLDLRDNPAAAELARDEWLGCGSAPIIGQQSDAASTG